MSQPRRRESGFACRPNEKKVEQKTGEEKKRENLEGEENNKYDESSFFGLSSFITSVGQSLFGLFFFWFGLGSLKARETRKTRTVPVLRLCALGRS